MKQEPEHHAWKQTAALRRKQIDEMPAAAPFGFATRVVARYRELRRNELFRAWERLSIRTAMVCSVCAVVFGIYSLIDSGQSKDEELIEVPVMTLDAGVPEL